MKKADLITFLEASIILQKNEMSSENPAWIDGYYQGKLAALEVTLELMKQMEE